LRMTSDLPYRPCAGVVLINREALVFTGERIDTPGAWQMPQGGIDNGETPLEAAYRELEEETGVPSSEVEMLAETPDWVTYDLPEHLVGKLWKGRYRGQKQKWFLFHLTGPDSLIDIAKQHPEFARWRWSTQAQVLSDIVPFKRAVYEEVIAAFKKELTP